MSDCQAIFPSFISTLVLGSGLLLINGTYPFASFLYSLKVSLKKLLATKPHGMAGSPGGNCCSFKLNYWLAQRCCTSIIGSQSANSETSLYCPDNWLSSLDLTYLL